MYPFLPIIGLVYIWWFIHLYNKVFASKKTVLFGPTSSGKTTFLRYISKDEIEEGQSKAPKPYKVRNAIFDYVTDFGGGDEWLVNGQFEEFIKEHDILLFFYSVDKFINNIDYRNKECFPRIDFINEVTNMGEQKVLMVGTFIDKVPGFEKTQVEKLFAEKGYAGLLKHSVYINTTQKECLKAIMNALKE